MKHLCTMLVLILPLAAQRKPGSQLDHLPPNMEVLTHFGERADISPDNRQVAFMTKSFGDAMMIDLETRVTRCLTCNVPAAAFLRVMHLSTGDYLLIGPDHFEDIRTSRTRDNELWVLKRAPGSKPVKLGQKMSEGAALSKKSLKISFSQTHEQASDLAPDASRLIVADIDLSGATPKLVNQKTVYESKDRNCVIEAQDFYDNDSKMTFTCYQPKGLATVMGIDLKTLQVVDFSKAPGTYNETEGIFPDGRYTCVEGDRQVEQLGGQHGSGNIDIWKLRLDGTGKDFVRLTHFNDYEGGKASNPVVSTDGRFMAFQVAKTTDPAGVGYGIVLLWFRKDSAPVDNQEHTATIGGTVKDPSNGVLPGVLITLSGTPLTRPLTAVTTSDGTFRLTGVPAGSFTLTEQLAGFKKIAQTIAIARGERVDVPTVTLELGAMSEPNLELLGLKEDEVTAGVETSKGRFLLVLNHRDAPADTDVFLKRLDAHLFDGGSLEPYLTADQTIQGLELIERAPNPEKSLRVVLMKNDALRNVVTGISIGRLWNWKNSGESSGVIYAILQTPVVSRSFSPRVTITRAYSIFLLAPTLSERVR